MSSNEATTSTANATVTTVAERPRRGGAGIPALLRVVQEEEKEASVDVSAGDDSEASSLKTCAEPLLPSSTTRGGY